MAEADAELLERVARWCAEAGRQAVTGDIRRALAPLGWDELLALRALLADPPPTRPLGPFALADIARGAPPDVAAERERAGRYRAEDEVAATPALAAPPSPARRRGARRPPPTAAGIVIRRARDATPAAPPVPPPAPPLVDELLLPEGRALIERLVRHHGARRAALAAALAAGWRRADGGTPDEDDLARLLDHHGLARTFARRERDDLLHALRAAGGVRAAAAARLGVDPAALAAALERLGATAQAELIREERRADLRARATLSERVRLLLGDEPRLRDLDLLADFEEDLRARLPEHVRALRAGGAPVAIALARSLSLTATETRALATRFGIDVARPRPAPGRTSPGAPRPGPGRKSPPRPASARPAPGRTSPGAPRPGPGRKAPPRPASARPASARPAPGTPAPGRRPERRGRPERRPPRAGGGGDRGRSRGPPRRG